jgi:hypothetical protein
VDLLRLEARSHLSHLVSLSRLLRLEGLLRLVVRSRLSHLERLSCLASQQADGSGVALVALNALSTLRT